MRTGRHSEAASVLPGQAVFDAGAPLLTWPEAYLPDICGIERRTISFDRRIGDQMIVVVEEDGYLTVESEGTSPVFAVNGE